MGAAILPAESAHTAFSTALKLTQHRHNAQLLDSSGCSCAMIICINIFYHARKVFFSERFCFVMGKGKKWISHCLDSSICLSKIPTLASVLMVPLHICRSPMPCRFLKQYRRRARWSCSFSSGFPPLAFTHQDFPWLPESFHNIMNCGWWKT